MPEIVLHGGGVLTPDGLRHTDVLIRNERVERIGSDLPAENRIDCRGALVGPGFVDVHVHFREPGFEWKEDISTGSAAAAAGGFTAVVVMPNTEPATDSAERVRRVRERGEQVGLVKVAVAGAVTVGRAGRVLAPLAEMWAAGVRVFSDDGDSVDDPHILTNAMTYLARVGGLISQHAEDRRLTAGGHMHEGSVAHRLGIGGLPARAEEEVVARDLEVVRHTGCRYHVQHVSTAGTVELVAAAKAEGLPVTAEATPHHLMLDHTEVERIGADAKMYPPLREQKDVEAVRSAVRTGLIDVVATDHAPHAPQEKAVPFEEAPRGVIGLETSAAVVNTAVRLDPVQFFERMSVAPARLAGLDGHGRWIRSGIPANLVVFDQSAEWIPITFASRSRNSPFIGRRLTGRVRATLFQGRPTFRSEPR